MGAAGESSDLARKRYETELEKLEVGRSTHFQLLTFKNGLASAESSELTARIAYLSALTHSTTVWAQRSTVGA